jgi:thiamine-monophosphate kinase
VSAGIEVARIPLSAAAQAALRSDPDLMQIVLAGGDDYEILCTVAPDDTVAFTSAAEAAGVRVTAIGRITGGDHRPEFRDARGEPLRLARTSFSHF